MLRSLIIVAAVVLLLSDRCCSLSTIVNHRMVFAVAGVRTD